MMLMTMLPEIVVVVPWCSSTCCSCCCLGVCRQWQCVSSTHSRTSGRAPSASREHHHLSRSLLGASRTYHDPLLLLSSSSKIKWWWSSIVVLCAPAQRFIGYNISYSISLSFFPLLLPFLSFSFLFFSFSISFFQVSRPQTRKICRPGQVCGACGSRT